MGFLKKIFKGKSADPTEKKFESYSVNHREEYKEVRGIEESCEQVLSSIKQLEEVKLEYKAVTAYLTDIQKIETMLPDEREELNMVAGKIVSAAKEKGRQRIDAKNISDTHYKILESFEDNMEKELRRMQENEIYQSKIDKDMKHLEGERASLHYQKEDLEKSQISLRKVGIMTGSMAMVLFLLFGFMDINYKINITVPFLMTIALLLCVAAYLFFETTKNKKEIKQIEAKQNRAIFLLNKVKIKYVNNKNALDYGYQKFVVKSYSELVYLYEQYKKAKEAAKQYQEATKQLDYSNRELIRILKGYQLEDPGIWIHQGEAILDNKEMVEVKHRLNVRRQTLRENMDYNEKLKEEGLNSMRKYLEEIPAGKNMLIEKEKVEALLRKHGIYL